MASRSNYWIRKMNSNRLSRRRFVGTAATAGAGAAALGLVGCGDDDDDDGDDDRSPTSTGSATSTGSPTGSASNLPDHPMYRGLPGAKKGGKYVFAQPDTPVGRDPHAYEIPGTHALVDPTHGYLFLQWPDDDPFAPVIYGELVEEWEQTSDTETVLTLRQGVKFQNVDPVNGREFTAEDVAYNIERMRDPRPENRLTGFFTPVTNVDVVDNYTVRITTSAPYAPMITNMAFNWAAMIPRELDDEGVAEEKAVGAGAWILENYENGVGATFRPNPDYWKPGLPFFDEMEMQLLPDAAVREAKFLAQEIDNGSVSALGSNAQTIESKKAEILQNIPGTEFVETDGSLISILHLYFNVMHPPFDNPDVRRAFTYAFPYQLLIDQFTVGRGRRTGPISSANAFWAVPDAELPATDMQRAQQLLSANGFEDGIEVETWVSQHYSGTALAPLVAGLYQGANIRITPRPLENAQWINDVYRGGADYPISTHADATYDDPDRILHEYYHSQGSGNHSHVNDPEIDRMATAQREELDREARKQIVIDMQKYIVDQAYEVPLATLGGITATPPWYKNIEFYTGISDSRRVLDVQWIDGGPRG